MSDVKYNELSLYIYMVQNDLLRKLAPEAVLAIPINACWSRLQPFTHDLALNHILLKQDCMPQYKDGKIEVQYRSLNNFSIFLSDQVLRTNYAPPIVEMPSIINQGLQAVTSNIGLHVPVATPKNCCARVIKTIEIPDKKITVLVIDRPLSGSMSQKYAKFLLNNTQRFPYDYHFLTSPTHDKLEWMDRYSHSRRLQSDRWLESAYAQKHLANPHLPGSSRQQFVAFLRKNPTLYRQGIPYECRAQAYRLILGVYEHKKSFGATYAATLLKQYYPHGVLTLGTEQSGPYLIPQMKEFVRTIKVDLGRTLPNHPWFKQDSSHQGQRVIEHVLVAFICHRPDIGYCQSMSMLAAAFYLIFQDLEDVFWGFCALVETVLPSAYYTPGLLGIRADAQVLDYFAQRQNPQFTAKVTSFMAGFDIITFRSFMTAFVSTLPIETCFRVWDILLVDGNQILIPAVLALFQHEQAQLLLMNDDSKFIEALNRLGKESYDCDSLITTAIKLRDSLQGPLRKRRQDALAALTKEYEDINAFVASKKVSHASATEEKKVDDGDSLLPQMPPAQRTRSASVLKLMETRSVLAEKYNSAFSLAQSALEHEAQDNLKGALEAQMQSIQLFLQASKLETNHESRNLTRKKLAEMLSHADVLKARIENLQPDSAAEVKSGKEQDQAQEPVPPDFSRQDSDFTFVDRFVGVDNDDDDSSVSNLFMPQHNAERPSRKYSTTGGAEAQAAFYLERAMELDTFHANADDALSQLLREQGGVVNEDDFVEVSLVSEEQKSLQALEAQLAQKQVPDAKSESSEKSSPIFNDVESIVLALDGYEQAATMYLSALRDSLTPLMLQGWGFAEEGDDMSPKQIKARLSAILTRVATLKTRPEYHEFLQFIEQAQPYQE